MRAAGGGFRLRASALACFALAACGSTIVIPEASSSGALAAATVAVRQTGDGQATIVPSSVTYGVDDAGLLVIHLMLTSTATAAQTVEVTASLFDDAGTVIADATGGQQQVAPGATVAMQLDGDKPSGTISAGTFEVTTVAAPTPTAATPAA